MRVRTWLFLLPVFVLLFAVCAGWLPHDAVFLAVVMGTPAPILQTVQSRKLFTSTMVASSTDRWVSPDFPRSLYSHLILQLNGTLTKTESSAGTLSENALSLIRSIRIKADGDIIKEFEPTMMRVFSHHICRGQDTDLTNVTLGSDTAEAFAARLIVDFQSARTRLPEASFFPGDRYGELGFEIDWGTSTDLVGGGTYTAVSFPTTPTLQVWGNEIINPVDRVRRYLLQRNFTKSFTRSSVAMTADSFTLPVGEVYRGVLLKQMTRNPDLASTTVIASTANIVVRVNGSFRKIETTWAELTARNKSQYGIALPSGYVYIDFMDAGDFNTALRTGDPVGVSSFDILADVSSVSGGQIVMMPITYRAARDAA